MYSESTVNNQLLFLIGYLFSILEQNKAPNNVENAQLELFLLGRNNMLHPVSSCLLQCWTLSKRFYYNNVVIKLVLRTSLQSNYYVFGNTIMQRKHGYYNLGSGIYEFHMLLCAFIINNCLYIQYMIESGNL